MTKSFDICLCVYGKNETGGRFTKNLPPVCRSGINEPSAWEIFDRETRFLLLVRSL